MTWVPRVALGSDRPESVAPAVRIALGGLQNGCFGEPIFERQHHFSAILSIIDKVGAFGPFLAPPKLEREHHFGQKTMLGTILGSPGLEFCTFVSSQNAKTRTRAHVFS